MHLCSWWPELWLKSPCLPPILNPCLGINQSFYRSLGWGCRIEGTCTYLGLHGSKYWGSVTMSTNTGTPAPPFVEAKSHIYEHTGPLPSANPMAPAIFQEGSRCLPFTRVAALNGFSISLQNISARARNYIPRLCATIIYLAQLRRAHLLDSDSTCHKLAKKSSSKQAGPRAQIPLPWTTADF